MRPKTRAIVLGAALVTGAAVVGIDWSQYIQKRYPNGSPVPPVINTKQTTLSGGAPLPVSCASGNVSSCMATANQNLLVSACKEVNATTASTTSQRTCKNANQYSSVSNYYASTYLPEHEGVKHHCYAPGDGTCTAGVGHVLGPAPCAIDCQIKGYYSNKTISEWLKLDLNSQPNGSEACVRNNANVKLNQAQFDSLTDIVYNMGCGGATSYGIWNTLNSGNYNKLSTLIKNRYTLANKIFWPGLKIRANEEASVFQNTSPEKCTQVSVGKAGI